MLFVKAIFEPVLQQESRSGNPNIPHQFSTPDRNRHYPHRKLPSVPLTERAMNFG